MEPTEAGELLAPKSGVSTRLVHRVGKAKSLRAWSSVGRKQRGSRENDQHDERRSIQTGWQLGA
jgi:hypothetical protein